MNEASNDPGDFLQEVFDQSQLDLRVTVYENESEYVLDLDGPDAELLQAQGGELLEAVQHLVNQACGRRQPKDRRIVCDVHGFRATREAELKAMAHHAAERVRSTGVEFTFGPMNANERRIIHLALADTPDLQTESVGEGADRKLRVGLKKPAF